MSLITHPLETVSAMRQALEMNGGTATHVYMPSDVLVMIESAEPDFRQKVGMAVVVSALCPRGQVFIDDGRMAESEQLTPPAEGG